MATFYSQWLGNLRSYIVITEKAKDVASNKTLLAWSVYADKTGTNNRPYNLTNTTPVQVSINGTQVFNANINYDLRTVNTQQIASGETYVSHDADGSKTVSISLMVDFSSTNYPEYYGYGKTTASGSMALATIARASSFSLSSYSFDFGTNVTVTINRASSDFTHNVTYTQPNGTVTSVSTTATTSATLNIPISYANQLGVQSSYTTTIKVETKNASGTSIGSHSTTATVNLPSTAKPTITGLTPGGQNTIIGNNVAPTYNYLGGIDKITTSIAITNASGATTDYVDYQLVNASGTVVASARGIGTTAVSITAPNVASGSEIFKLQARAVDSRARASNWVTSTIQLRVHAYSNPSIWGLTVGRLIADQTKVDGVVSWNVSRISNGGGTTGQVNTASMTVKYRLKGASTWTNVTTNTALSSENYDIPFDGITFAVSSNYEFMAEVTDAFGKTSTTSIINVSGAFVHMDFGPKGVGIGKDHSDSNYDLEVGAGGLNVDGGIKRGGFDISQGRHSNFKDFVVGGDANTYYPVFISGQSMYGFNRYSISRMYNWQAPDTWNTATHRGGLTFDFEWTGDSAWGGNDKTIRVIEFFETYTTMVGGISLVRHDGIIVWLRGGSAVYRLQSEMGSFANVIVYLSTFTDLSGATFPTRTSPVNSEIYDKYPVRGSGELYSLGSKVPSEADVKTLMAGSVANYDVNSWLRVIRNQLEVSDRIDANFVTSNSVIWCKVPSAFNVPAVNGLLMSFTIDSTQRSQIYYGADNKLYQRQYQNSVWGAWSSGR